MSRAKCDRIMRDLPEATSGLEPRKRAERALYDSTASALAAPRVSGMMNVALREPYRVVEDRVAGWVAGRLLLDYGAGAEPTRSDRPMRERK